MKMKRLLKQILLVEPFSLLEESSFGALNLCVVRRFFISVGSMVCVARAQREIIG